MLTLRNHAVITADTAPPRARRPCQCTMSTATESLTQKWLQQAVQPYAFKDAVYTHVNTVLSRFNTIRPKTDVYSSVSSLPS
jgi:hypothetical protein